jgi:polyphosphate kinase
VPTSYFNRELSWLKFNQRVLWEAERESLPLLERVKFLAISASNLDEFFMVRVGGLKTLVKTGARTRDLNGLTPVQQLRQIRQEVRAHYEDQYRIWRTMLEPALTGRGIRYRRPEQIAEQAREKLKLHFSEEIEELLNPVAMDLDEQRFRISGERLCVLLDLGPAGKPDHADRRSVVITIPSGFPRFLRVPDTEGYEFVLLEDLIQAFADEMFPQEETYATGCFRLTRNGDIPVQEDYAEDLAEAMETVLTARKFSNAVRLEVPTRTSKRMLETMLVLTGSKRRDVYRVPSLLDLSSLMAIASLEDFDHLREATWKPQPFVPLKEHSIFEVLDDQDLLLHHPYDSFEPVVRLVEEAADDPDVIAIKQVLYRTSSNSRIIAALIRASEKGKNVVVLVELKARFDEARNLERAEELELAGAQVVYGIKGLKCHAKACLIMRREAGRIRRYVHFGTGNYNESTARLYTDVSYLTARSDYGRDASAFFNGITGRSQWSGLRKLLPAPTRLKKTLLELIAFERDQAKQGETAEIMAKVNSLQDKEIIDALYEASQAGVKIQLMVRGICCLRPQVPGLSETIVVHSLIDRYLEHARIFSFHHGGEQQVFLSSADWMRRNLDKRVELMVPVEDSQSRNALLEILRKQFKDNVQAWFLGGDGSYGPAISGQKSAFRLQAHFAKQAAKRTEEAQRMAADVLEMHLPPDEATQVS